MKKSEYHILTFRRASKGASTCFVYKDILHLTTGDIEKELMKQEKSDDACEDYLMVSTTVGMSKRKTPTPTTLPTDIASRIDIDIMQDTFGDHVEKDIGRTYHTHDKFFGDLQSDTQ